MNTTTALTIMIVSGLLYCGIVIYLPLRMFSEEQLKAQYHIYRTFIPLYRKIEAEYGPESYPAVMSEPYCEYFDLSGLDHWDYVFFKKDSSFVIMNIKDGSIKCEIPFDSIICADSYRDIRSKRWYHSSVRIYFRANDKDHQFRFNALKYSQQLNKKFNAQYSGKKLHDYIRANFIRYQNSELR